MPNAKDVTGIQKHKILLLGNTGSGKTTQFLTLPGKKFLYIFDPNALLSIRGHDIEYEQFLPTDMSFDIKSLDKDVKGDAVMGRKSSEVFVAFEKDYEAKKKSGFFNDFDVIGIDSATTLLDLIMDRMLTINGRPNQFPRQDDYGPQMITFTNIMRELTGLGKIVMLTGHLKTDKDELTQRIVQLPLFTGQLREKIPLLFSDIFKMEASTDQKGNVSYLMHTVPNQRETPIRCSIRGLKPVENVTVDWSKPPIEQGLGALIVNEKR